MDDATSSVAAGRVDLAFGVDHPPAPVPRAADVTLTVLGTEAFSLAVGAARAAPSGPASLRHFAEEAWVLPPEHTSYGRAVRTATTPVR